MTEKKFRVYARRLSETEPYSKGYWLMTPSELLERVRKDSESNYDWITSATELVWTCSHADFPDEVAAEIKDLVLGCFANLGSIGRLHGDKVAVYNCYRSTKDEELKARFSNNIIANAIAGAYHDELVWMIYSDREFEAEFAEWKLGELRVLEYGGLSFDDFKEWCESMPSEYSAALDRAIEEGGVKPADFFSPVEMSF